MVQFLMVIFKRFSKVHTLQVLRVCGFLFVLLLYATAGYRYFEGRVNPDLGWDDSLWWAIVTMTTVGYGDLYPTTLAGRFLVGFPTMLLGVSILGYVLSVGATAMMESRLKEIKGMSEMEWKNHILICNYVGLEKTSQVIREIHHDASTCDCHVVIIDETLDELPPELQSDLIHFVKGSPAREATLVNANIGAARAVILQVDPASPVESDNANLRAALMIETRYPEIFSCVECANPDNIIFFELANCDSVVCIASLSGQMVVQELQDPGVSDVVAELTSNKHGRQFYIAEIKENLPTYQAVQQHYTHSESVVVGIRRGAENILVPSDDFPVKPGDRAVLIAATRPV
ncbi:MAG: ion channel [Pontiella sp.]